MGNGSGSRLNIFNACLWTVHLFGLWEETHSDIVRTRQLRTESPGLL